MKETMLVLGAERFDGEIDGSKIKSGKIFVLGASVPDGNHFGHTVGTYSVGYDNVEKYGVVPAFYDIEMALVKSKPVIVGSKLVTKDVDLMSLLEANRVKDVKNVQK